jgi:PKD repeat protein
MRRTASLLCSIVAVCAFISVSLSSAAQVTIVPTTTLSAETSNNTSTSATFSKQPNGNAEPGNVSKTSVRNLLYPGSTTRINAALMPWFGRPDHMSVGYTSSDPAQIAAQINDMKSRGIQGVIIPWYGPDSHINSDTAINFMQSAQSSGNFEFSIMIDVGALLAFAQQNGCDVTAQLIDDLNYIASTFYASSAYTRVNGRPFIYLFGVEAYYIDWNRVASSISSNPMFMIRNPGAFIDTNAEGAYSWLDLNPSNPNDMTLSYLDAFYIAAESSSKYTVGSGYKGFNDTLAGWGSNRILNQQCGLTWLDMFAEANKYYSSSHQLPAIQVVTWNDYEEGTEIESGIDNCVVLAPSVTGSTLSWSIGDKASESTIDDYSVFISTDGQNLMKLADVAAGTHTLSLSQYNLAPGTYVLYVKAIGKASIVDHMSPAVAFNPSDQAPLASLSLSPTYGPAPLTVSASSAASSDPDGNVTAVRLDFGDGTVVSGGPGLATSHTYQASGTYAVILTVIDNAGVFSSTQQIVSVAAGPGVTITSPALGATVNSPVHVAATAFIVGGVSYMDVLVDGVTPPAYSATGSMVDTFLQIAAGTHTLRVVAHDTTTAANYIKSDVIISVGGNHSPPSAVLTVNSFGGGNQVMACTATSSDSDGFIIGSLVDFGDGATASGPTAFHTYASAGTYQVTAIVTDNAGLTSTSQSSTVTITGVATPTVNVIPSLSSFMNPFPLPVTISVSLGASNPTPTGMVALSGGGYTSPPATLAAGSTTITIPGGSLIAGTYSLTATYTPDAASASIYGSATGSSSVAVTAPAPSIAITGTAVSFQRGASVGNTSTITLTPSGAFVGNVALSASITSSPPGAQLPPTLSFGSTSPVSITSANAATATLTISTTAATSSGLEYPARPGGRWYATGGAALAGILLLFIPTRRRRWQTMLGMFVLLFSITYAVSACGGSSSGGRGGSGGGNSGTTAGTYTITVTGTSGAITQTAVVSLTVQ